MRRDPRLMAMTDAATKAPMGNVTDSALSPAEVRTLTRLASIMIPADASFNVPAAGDAAVIGDICRTIGRDLVPVQQALAALTQQAGGDFTALDDARAEAVAMDFLGSGTPAVATLGRVVLQCYYRDDRVVRSLGLEPRPPFPKGHVLPDGDWSLLEVVKARKPFWRDDRGAA
jgi:hypothetical protein